MIFESSVVIAATPQRVWEVFFDVERWPEWTESIAAVERLDPGPLTVGSRTRVKQPGLPASVWKVTEIVEGESFTWVATGPGFRTTGIHRVEPAGDGSRAFSIARQEGPLGGLLGRAIKRMTDRYLAMESAGLKARSESPG